MDKDVTAPLVKAKEMCYILPFLAFSFATVANKKANLIKIFIPRNTVAFINISNIISR